MTIREIISELENFAPLAYQEDYDNSGLITGDGNWEATGALLTLDCTEEVLEEALKNKCNLVIAHHPIVFSGLKKIQPTGYVERTIIKAIKNDIAIYACHTNIDHVEEGVNKKIADKLGLQQCRILAPKNDLLKKLVTFVPLTHLKVVREALFEAGAGHIGNYDMCSFSLEGKGTFRGNSETTPYVGTPGNLSEEPEARLEVILPSHLEKAAIRGLVKAHPYEEVAYDVFRLSNNQASVGSGMIGNFAEEMNDREFLDLVKKTFKVPVVKHTRFLEKNIRTVAVCGGSGRFLLKNAIAAGADAFITADFKYHEYFDTDGRILLADTGHYESEQFTPEIFYDVIRKKFSTFAIHLSKINTNPVNYY